MMSEGGQTRTEVVSEVVFLGKLVDRVAAGTIRVPRFQRPFVWKQSDVYALLDSVLRGFPIGSILVWDTETAIETTERVGPINISPARAGLVSYLLDGQQRVSTLVGTLRLPAGADSTVDQVDWRVYCNLETRQFLRAPRGSLKPQHFPVRSLLNTAGFFAACRRIESHTGDKALSRRWLDEADRLASAFRDYQLPVIHIREADLDSAVAVFARLNRRGRKMAADEMVSALTYREGEFHLAARLDEFKEELARKGFGNLDRVLLLRAVLAALGRDIYAKDWGGPDGQAGDPVEASGKLRRRGGGNQPRTDISQGSGRYDRSIAALWAPARVARRVFSGLCPQPRAAVVKLLRRWFWVTSYTGWFGGVNNTQATRALNEIRNLAVGKGVWLQGRGP